MSGDRSSSLTLHRRLSRVWFNPGGLRGVTAVNHTIVGKRFLLTALCFFLFGGLLAMLIRAQLATSENAFLDHDAYAQVFSMHGTVMMFLFAIPMIEGIVLYLLPKMLGARDLAFPRLSAFGYWCYLFGGLIVLGSFVMGLAPNTGWFHYTPLSGAIHTPGVNSDVWLIGVTFVEISAVAVAAEIAVSVLTVRTAGMSLNRMPLFAWYMLVTAGMMLVGFPPLILASVLLEVERSLGWPFFEVASGGDPLLWQHLFWLFGHPEVYIIFVPAAGIVSTLVVTFARRSMVGYAWVVASVFGIGVISFGLWVHHMFTVGIPHLAQVFFSAASMLVAVPTAVQFFAWIATLWYGRPRLQLPMLYLFGFLVTFVIGGLTGVMVALVPFDWQVHDTHFVVAHLHYVLVGGFVFPLLAGAYYWFPHMTGRMPSVRLGQWAFWLIFIGFNVTFFIMHLTGLLGMPRRVYVYSSELGWDLPNLISSVGGFIMAAGIGAFLLDLLLYHRLGSLAPRNPWGAGTLEWAMATPPPIYNFASQPLATTREPVWSDEKLPDGMAAGRQWLAGAATGEQETLGVAMLSGRPSHVIMLPRPSALPLYAALALAVLFLAVLFRAYLLVAPALLVALLIFLRWAWLCGVREDVQPVAAGPDGTDLPLHSTVNDAPGWWGLLFTLVANGTFFLSMLFGYFYLWVVAPNWPPPSFIDVPTVFPVAAVAALIGGAVATRIALAANSRVHPGACGVALWVMVGVALASAALLAAMLRGVAPPQSHAYSAVVTFCIAYGIFHCALGAVIAAFAAVRHAAGFISVQRNLDIRILKLWWDYTAIAGVLLVLAIFLVPFGIGT